MTVVGHRAADDVGKLCLAHTEVARPITAAMRCIRDSRLTDSASRLKVSTAGKKIAFSVP
jgi:hypothetical protein